jgi:hypothetical protein
MTPVATLAFNARVRTRLKPCRVDAGACVAISGREKAAAQESKTFFAFFGSHLLFIQNRVSVHVLKCIFLGCEEEEAVTEAREQSAVLFYLDAA